MTALQFLDKHNICDEFVLTIQDENLSGTGLLLSSLLEQYHQAKREEEIKKGAEKIKAAFSEDIKWINTEDNDTEFLRQ